MENICTNCHYIGKPKTRRKPIRSGIIVSAILGIIFSMLAFWHPAFLIGTFFFISFSLFLFADYFVFDNVCPACDVDSMISLQTKSAQKLIVDNELSVEAVPKSLFRTYEYLKYQKRMICTKCHGLTSGIPEIYPNLTLGIVILSVGLISISFAYITPLALIATFFYLMLGFTLVLGNFLETRVCNRCRTESIIPLNAPEAKQIISEQNIDFDYYAKMSNPPLFSYRYSFYLLFISWIAIGYLTFQIYRIFNNN